MVIKWNRESPIRDPRFPTMLTHPFSAALSTLCPNSRPPQPADRPHPPLQPRPIPSPRSSTPKTHPPPARRSSPSPIPSRCSAPLLPNKSNPPTPPHRSSEAVRHRRRESAQARFLRQSCRTSFFSGVQNRRWRQRSASAASPRESVGEFPRRLLQRGPKTDHPKRVHERRLV